MYFVIIKKNKNRNMYYLTNAIIKKIEVIDLCDED